MIGDRWGVTDAEVARRYPCDDVVPTPSFQAWRGVTARTAPDRVWPWVAQIRLAPYAYDWIDNYGRRSPRALQGLPEPEPGEPFSAAFGGRPVGRILSVEPGVQLTGLIRGTVMSYVLVPTSGDGDGDGDRDGDAATVTRLLLKLAASGRRAAAPLLGVGDLVMARKQLRTLARLAEGTPPAEHHDRHQRG